MTTATIGRKLTRFADGSLRWVPPKLRGKARVKAAKRQRQKERRLREQSRAKA